MDIFGDSVRCPDCRDLFIPEGGKLPVHFLDTFDGTECCSGSGVIRLGWALGDGNYASRARL